VAFVLIAVALGAQIPASLANSLSQGYLGPVAVLDAAVDIGVAVLAFSIAPLSALSRRLLRQPGQPAPIQTAS
jgi:hypothetical protein